MLPENKHVAFLHGNYVLPLCRFYFCGLCKRFNYFSFVLAALDNTGMQSSVFPCCSDRGYVFPEVLFCLFHPAFLSSQFSSEYNYRSSFCEKSKSFWYMSKKVRCSHIKICVFLLLINKSRKVLSLKPRKLICSAVQTYPIICRKQNFNVNWLTLLEPVFIDIILTVIKD